MLNANEIIALFCIKVGWPTPKTYGNACYTLHQQGLIDEDGLTERGQVFVDHVEKFPLPAQTWSMK